MADERGLSRAFVEIHAGLPRQGVGSDAETARALALCTDLPVAPQILDIGCGPGRQSLVLAWATGGHVTAVDLYAPFLDELSANAASAGMGDRITTVKADMHELPFQAGTFDLVWSEGAAYIMGISEALTAWRPLLRPGGYLGFSEIVWAGDERPAAVVDLLEGYPGKIDVAGNLARIAASGYESVGHFRLPESAWWDEYYDPLAARLPEFERRYAGDRHALAVVAATRLEIEVRREHPDAYAYDFFVARPRPGPT